MLVFELQLKIRFSRPIPYENVSEVIGNFIDSSLGKSEQYLAFHESREVKYYVFDMPYKIPDNHIYQANEIYGIRIRTVKQDLAEYFSENLPRHRTNDMLGLSGELKIIPKKFLDRVYTLTPIIIQTDQGYWRGTLPVSEFENRLKVNLIKKYNKLNDTKIDEDFPLYQAIEFKNQKPIKVPYKNIVLLGDKINLVASHHEMAQEVLYMALGTGIGERNGRGSGFLNYRYL